jgi:beta-galactosidase/beta-glucuronidase
VGRLRRAEEESFRERSHPPYIKALPPTPRPEYPRPRLRRREWVNLNGPWQFAFDAPNFDRSIIVPFAYQAALSGIGEHTLHDTVWYRRRFERPIGARLLLHFGAVDYHATVWVNDVEVAHHDGGHTPFSVDISAVVRPGDNELVVRADDPATDRSLPRGKQYWKAEPETIFYTATTGIWQTVWLEPLPERHIASLRLWPRLDEGALAFDVRTSDPQAAVELSVSLRERPVGTFIGRPGHNSVPLSEVEAWTPENPVLYEVMVRLVDDAGRDLDRVESYFGLRTVATRDGRFLLNGEPYIQRLVLDQGYFPGGWYTAASDADLRRDIELAKGLGFNGARKHQKIEDPRWLYWADRVGFLVWGEMPNFHEHTPLAEQRLLDELAAAIERDREHPCIVVWVPMNESWGLPLPSQVEVAANFLERLHARARELDATRPVVSNDGWEHARTDLCTLHDYGMPDELQRRYRTIQSALEPSGRPRPPYLPGYGYQGEPMLVSEFGGIALEGSGGWGYGDTASQDQLVHRYAQQVVALMDAGPVEGFCYTQLTDVEQERNGLLTFDRQNKADPAILRPITETIKRR